MTRALQEAADRDLVIKNPANRLKGKLPAIEISESRVASVDEAHQLADAIGGRWEAFVLFAFYAGTRWGETAALRRSRLNLRRGTALIDATLARDLTLKAPKTARSRRTVHLPDPLTRALRGHLDRFYRIGTDPDLVFTASEGGPFGTPTGDVASGYPPRTRLGLMACASTICGTATPPSSSTPASTPSESPAGSAMRALRSPWTATRTCSTATKKPSCKSWPALRRTTRGPAGQPSPHSAARHTTETLTPRGISAVGVDGLEPPTSAL